MPEGRPARGIFRTFGGLALRGAGAGALGIALATAAPTFGCQDKRCDGSEATFGKGSGEGRLIEADTWESNAMGERWLDFGAERVWTFDLRDVAGSREIVEVFPYVSEMAEPNGPDASNARAHNFTLGAGNLAVVRLLEPGVFLVRNATCATYFLRVVVHFSPDEEKKEDAGEHSGEDAGGDTL